MAQPKERNLRDMPSWFLKDVQVLAAIAAAVGGPDAAAMRADWCEPASRLHPIALVPSEWSRWVGAAIIRAGRGAAKASAARAWVFGTAQTTSGTRVCFVDVATQANVVLALVAVLRQCKSKKETQQKLEILKKELGWRRCEALVTLDTETQDQI